MAVYNEIQVGRFNRYLQKLLSMKGPASMNVLAPELQFQLAGFVDNDVRLLQGWNLYSNSVSFAAVAGANATFQLRNPANSNVAAVITNIAFFDSGTRLTVDISFADTTIADLGGATGSSAWDARNSSPGGLASQSTCIFSTSNAGATGDLVNLAWVQTTGSFPFPNHPGIPLMPNSCWRVRNPTANQTMNAVIFWMERFLEDSERTV